MWKDNSLANHLVRMPRPAKRLLALAVDTLMCIATVWLALCLRLEGWVVLQPAHWKAIAAAVALSVPIFYWYGLYASVFRYAGWQVMLALVRAMAVYTLPYVAIFTWQGVAGVPRAIGVLQPLLMLVGVGASRVLVRFTLGDLYRSILDRRKASGVMIFGAGSAGRQLASALRHSSEHRLMGFIDDDPDLQGRQMDMVPVHAPANLSALLETDAVSDVLLAIPSLGRKRRLEIVDFLRSFPVHVRTLPGVADLANGRVDLSDLHEIDVEDLLGRDAVEPDAQLMQRHVRGKVVMVTGAGGSIGQELCRQIAQCGPRRLLLVEQSEYSLYQVQQELQALLQARPEASGELAPVELVPLLASVTDERRMTEIVATWSPHTVYHAAAYKHVPLVEHNMLEGVRNNVWGTWICARVAAAHGVENFVLISTDKAVRPTNVMGASKRLAEMVLQALANRADLDTCFTMVRFGNVLGSSGSVVPLFRKQIAHNGPITLTHAGITRYFMTIPEASQLVMQAGAMARGGDVFVLDMGEPVRIYDLACRMVELSGLRVRDRSNPHGDIEIRVTGLRPGEKLYEELLIGDGAQPTSHPRILKAHESFLPWPQLVRELGVLESAMARFDIQATRDLLLKLVSGYRPANGLVDWVYLEGQRQQDRGAAKPGLGVGQPHRLYGR
ncbi:MAG: polysaccharide biosynthesis protein [Comamonas sp.]